MRSKESLELEDYLKKIDRKALSQLQFEVILATLNEDFDFIKELLEDYL